MQVKTALSLIMSYLSYTYSTSDLQRREERIGVSVEPLLLRDAVEWPLDCVCV